MVVVHLLNCVQLLPPHGLQPARLLCSWDSPGRILEWVPFPSPGDLADPGIEPGSPPFQVDSLPTELQGNK